MKKVYERPAVAIERFVPNQYIAGCDWSIVSGDDAVRVYCVKTSYITVFTSDNGGCTYQRSAFTSTSEATNFFSSLFQWGQDVAEASNDNTDYTKKWTQAQRDAANAEINNGWITNTGTITVGKSNRGTVHAGYALDFLNGTGEGKALS